jgi:uncharacterized iron-regulated protein
MKIILPSKLWACSLGLILLWAPPALTQRITSPGEPEPLHRRTVLTQLAKARVLYLGETHDNPQDHAAQLDIIQSLYQKQPKIAIALEMFQRPYQPILDSYLAGKISETQLRVQSQYDQRWGFPWESYAPILRFAQTHQLPLIALNTPTEVTRKVARQGLESLTVTEQTWIPPLAAIDTDDSTYRQRLLQIYQESHQQTGSADRFEQFFQAQVLWDETMAEGIAQFLTTHPEHLVVVLAGRGHVIYGEGIPSRVARRLSPLPTPLRQLIVLLNPVDAETHASPPAATYFWEH